MIVNSHLATVCSFNPSERMTLRIVANSILAVESNRLAEALAAEAGNVGWRGWFAGGRRRELNRL